MRTKKELRIRFALTVVSVNLWNSSFSGIVGKEVRFHRVIEGVSTEEMEEADRDHAFKSLDEAEEKWDNGN